MSRRRDLLLVAGAGVASLAAPRRLRAQATPARKVNIVMTQGVSGLALHELARQQGYFTEARIEPNVLLVSDGAKCVAALLSGASEICMWSGFNQVTPAIERGGAMKILAGSLSLPSLALYSAKPGVRKLSDLEGKVVGIGAPGTVLHQMMVYLMTKENVSADKVMFRNVGSNADILKAVVAGTVDAGLSDVDVFDQQEKYGIHTVEGGLLWEAIPDYTNQATYASDAAIREHRDDLVRLLAAYAKAYRYVCSPESRDAFIKARQTVTGEADTQHAISQWSWIQKTQPYAKDLILTDEQINLVQRLNIQFKTQRQVLPIEKVADMSLARDAVKMLA
ncbi:ABC transporter substrate-binding protein [Roseomonas elaeocarpi]|uniref:ABC transporter substrate-binding protein n=1 Tax=Roseomonas elaeocarpi TaxID=907779 RepID=A0ABV6JYH0_9PROT